jgi:hypothetical protein
MAPTSMTRNRAILRAGSSRETGPAGRVVGPESSNSQRNPSKLRQHAAGTLLLSVRFWSSRLVPPALRGAVPISGLASGPGPAPAHLCALLEA